MLRETLCASALATALVASTTHAETTLRLVEVITSPPRTELLKKQVAEFEKSNPDIKVEVISLQWGQAFEKFLTMVQAGDTPDVAEMPEGWMGLYGSNGQLEDLGPFAKTWPDYATLGESAKHFGSVVDSKLYSIPYGFYIRAMFWNKKLFAQAGLSGPPKTIDEFMDDNKKISAIQGKYGYCLRGGRGGFTSAQMFMNTLNDKPGFFNADGTSTFDEPGSTKGLALLGEIYQKGYAPKDSVGWGFNEIVAGFYSGTCAMLDQDPDALIGIADKMGKDDFAVAPMPTGPSGKAYPAIAYSGWAMFKASKSKPESFKLISFLISPKNNIEWAKFVGVLPIHNGANNDLFFSSEQFSGWFEELKNPDKYVFPAPPSHLENLAQFFDQMAPRGIQQVLLGQRSAAEITTEWAKFLTAEQKAWMAKNAK